MRRRAETAASCWAHEPRGFKRKGLDKQRLWGGEGGGRKSKGANRKGWVKKIQRKNPKKPTPPPPERGWRLEGKEPTGEESVLSGTNKPIIIQGRGGCLP